MTFSAHHDETIQRTVEYFKTQPDVEALLLGGSLAHGFAAPSSDVDVMIIISEAEHRRRLANNDLQFFTTELATYPGGYIDGKYISAAFLEQVAQHGSEPARFAFADAQILFSRTDGLDEQLQRIVRYPVEDKISRIERFVAQLNAWYWYAGEADKKRNTYLADVAASKLLLFGGRMILAHNELLYPFHKWFLAVLARAERKPEGLIEVMQRYSASPSYAGATEFYNLITNFRSWEGDPKQWPNHFMLDTELTWMNGSPPIDDL
jgi:predicted nucleotidyltransferase